MGQSPDGVADSSWLRAKAAVSVRVVVAVPCHRDEPGVGSTVGELLRQIEQLPQARVVVCINGADPEHAPAALALAPLAAGTTRLRTVYLERASKPAAWTRLKQEEAEVTVFCDADVSLAPGSVGALVAALAANGSAVLATARQRPAEPQGTIGRVAVVPFRLNWGGVAGTLYAARTAWLPDMPMDVLLDDAWLWSQAAGEHLGAVVAVPEAVAVFRPAESLRDLWRQRVRAEAGKRQLRSMGLPLADAAPGSGLSALSAYPRGDWPALVALAGIKLAASLWSRARPVRWNPAASTKA